MIFPFPLHILIFFLPIKNFISPCLYREAGVADNVGGVELALRAAQGVDPQLLNVLGLLELAHLGSCNGLGQFFFVYFGFWDFIGDFWASTEF